MALGTVETIAAIFVLVGILKLLFIFFSPKTWFGFAKKVYSKPKVISFISLILAAVVLYYLLGAGITILQIFAVMTFMVLLVAVGLANHVKQILKFYEKKNFKKILAEQWLYMILWIVLLIWGLKELLAL